MAATPDRAGCASEAATRLHARSCDPALSAAPCSPAPRERIARRAVAELLEGGARPIEEAPHRGLGGDALPVATMRADAGGLFVDTMIADALLDAGVEPQHPRIARTIHAILQRYPAEDTARAGVATRLRDAPDDVAALAQALLLLARLGRRDLIVAHCTPPLAILLAYAEADGAIPAWALPDDASPEAVEAIASLVYGLARWDARRFLGMVVAGARWVAERQQPDGRWAGGDGLYGSWQALRLLGAVMPNHPAVARAAGFLHDSRRADGGWGVDGSDPLTTALAALALVATRTAIPEGLPEQVRALLAPGRSGWPASAFPRPARAALGTPARVDPGSPAVTALFALKASEALAADTPRR
ncbi:hypothetical protein [Sphingomonas pituitosa]|uniref:hypothetical protein n=1 Tax=Sphingomonas pituitosa TaxID=99597 RepID=UPI001C3F8917|nr:hypothetical protein [Sphingomonas pituitosa]